MSLTIYATDFLAMQFSELDKFGHNLCGAKKYIIASIIVPFSGKTVYSWRLETGPGDRVHIKLGDSFPIRHIEIDTQT